MNTFNYMDLNADMNVNGSSVNVPIKLKIDRANISALKSLKSFLFFMKDHIMAELDAKETTNKPAQNKPVKSGKM